MKCEDIYFGSFSASCGNRNIAASTVMTDGRNFQSQGFVTLLFARYFFETVSIQYVMSKRLKENQTNNTVLRTEITFQVLNKYVVAVIIRMETYKNIE